MKLMTKRIMLRQLTKTTEAASKTITEAASKTIQFQRQSTKFKGQRWIPNC
jgi:hypothetical protein